MEPPEKSPEPVKNERQKRLGAALRENLRKRKRQLHDRQQSGSALEKEEK